MSRSILHRGAKRPPDPLRRSGTRYAGASLRAGDARGVNVLIADDDAGLLAQMRGLIEAEGHVALCAEDGAEAWELYRNGDCRLVISDWDMPGMDGPDLVRRIRAE